MPCFRCGEVSEMEIDLYFGYKNLLDYKIGDKVEWLSDKAVQNGGRPKDGNLNGQGYTECPKCKKDFFVLVQVRNDVIENIEADLNKKSYIST